jgi:hypothetical protein
MLPLIIFHKWIIKFDDSLFIILYIQFFYLFPSYIIGTNSVANPKKYLEICGENHNPYYIPILELVLRQHRFSIDRKQLLVHAARETPTS